MSTDPDPPQSPGRLSRILAAVAWTALAGTAGATVLGFAGRLHWRLELAAHFRVQYFLAALVLAALFAALRRRAGLATATAVLLVNTFVLAPLYIESPPLTGDAAAAQRQLRLLIANVFSANRDHGRLLALVRAERPDLLLLMEVDPRWEAALAALHADYPHRLVRARSDNFGIALFSRHPLQRAEVMPYGGAGVPSILARIEHGGRPLSILLTHPVPPVARQSAALRDGQLAEAGAAVQKLGPRVVLAGDFNTTPWSPAFADLLERTDLRNTALGYGAQSTWPSWLPAPCRIPIDHCLTDLEVLDRRVGPSIGSDHLPLIVDVR